AKQASGAASKGASDAAKTALEAQKAYADAMVQLANSDVGKAAAQLAMTATPQGKAATVFGGLMNAAKGSGDPAPVSKAPVNTGVQDRSGTSAVRKKTRS
ncbi:MAG: hypothetical protein AAF227_11100, partial [Pseudomonadota bacterium]